MKKLCAAVVYLLILLTFAVSALAAPSVEMMATLSDAIVDETGMFFVLNIGVKAPSEAYASLDFNLVCGNSEQLAIVDKSSSGDRSNLDITFPSEYGGAYHKGRINEETGAISYLIGIYSPMGGNAITDEIDVCSVALHYTGQEPQTLSIEDLKIVYKDASGQITSTNGFAEIEFVIDSTLFADIADEDVPTAYLGPNGDSTTILILYITLGALVLAIPIFWIARKRRLKARS